MARIENGDTKSSDEDGWGVNNTNKQPEEEEPDVCTSFFQALAIATV